MNICVYFIEYQNSVKFFNKDNTIEILKDSRLISFIKACYKKYGKQIKFKELI